MTILVFGSLNMDLVVQSPRLPIPGETILGTHFATIPGGKGANQAVAVARQHVPTRMVGCVGNDDFGDELREGLTAEGVDVEYVRSVTEAHTGIAAIAVADQGENHIVVVPGANGCVDSSDLAHLETLLPAAQILLLQLEIPIPMVVAAAKLAHAAGVTVILDPAPAQSSLPESLYHHIDILTPNQVEAAQLVGFSVNTAQDAVRAANALYGRGVKTVLIKLGEQGVVCVCDGGCFHTRAFSVEVVDTVAAGDAFNGGLAVALYEGKPRRAATKWAAATAALSVTQSGARPAIPTRSQVDAFLHRQK